VVSTRIDWVREHCQLLRAISAEFGRTRPFDGLTIGTGIHLEAKTVASRFPGPSTRPLPAATSTASTPADAGAEPGGGR
jgi:hypothetical protein